MDIEDVRRIEFKPGDRLVMRVERPLTMEQRSHIRGLLEQFAPDVPVLILEPGMSLEILSEAAE